MRPHCITEPPTSSKIVLLIALLFVALLAIPVTAKSEAELPTLREASRVNNQTVGIVFHYEDSYRRLIVDLTAELNESSDIRLVPVIGVNHVQSIYDLLYMNGIDLAVVHADVMEYLVRTGRYDRVRLKIHGLTKLFSEKVAVIAGEQYQSLEDLAGEEVNFGKIGKGSDITSTILFDSLNINVTPVRLDKLDALEKVKSGELAATVYLIEGPMAEFQSLSSDHGVNLLEIPKNAELSELYPESELTEDEFPNLLTGNNVIPTIAVDVILASYNWPKTSEWRYEKLNRFVTAFVSGFNNLQKNAKEPAWSQVVLQQDIPGVTRSTLVDDAIVNIELEKARIAAAEKLLQEELIRQQNKRIKDKLISQVDETLTKVEDPEKLEKILEQFGELLEKSE